MSIFPKHIVDATETIRVIDEVYSVLYVASCYYHVSKTSRTLTREV